MRDLELYHYGVKGMKWGVRKEYEYSSRKRPKKKESESSDKQKKRFSLSDKQKKAIKIGAAVAVTALAVYGGYKLAKTGKLDGLIKKGKLAADAIDLDQKAPKIDPKTGLQFQEGNFSITENLKKVNPMYSELDQSSYMNCGNCAIAFEARMRGYDVTALGNTQGMLISNFGQFFKGFNENSFHKVDIDDIKDPVTKGKVVKDTIKSSISKAYDGNARGCIFFTGEYGSHYFNWIKNGVNVDFYDGQNPNADLDAMFSTYKRHTRAHSACQTTFFRVDDLEINGQNIKNVIKNVGDNVNFHNSNFDPYVIKGENFVTNYVI